MTNGPSSTGKGIDRIKNSSRFWLVQTHSKIRMKPDFGFRARDPNYLEFAEYERVLVVSLDYDQREKLYREEY